MRKRANHKYRRQFFSSRVVEKWNCLPTEVREATTVSHFKRLYRRYTQATVAPAINEQGRTRKHATQPEHPHRGPRWINEDHLPSIPSKLVRLSDHVVLAALQHPSQQEAGILELYDVCIINFELLLPSNIRQQIITLLFELLFLST